MHIITKRRLIEFWESHADAQEPLSTWYTVSKEARWNSLNDLRQRFPNARTDGRFTIFRLGGNKYRLITRVEYKRQQIYIRNVLTHEEYSKNLYKRDDWYHD